MAALGGGDLAFVPTMGAFHEGHLSLMREARKAAPRVCVSIFVNPLQFGPGEDLSRYPRNEDRDFDLADSLGVDIVFAPSAGAMYPRQITKVCVPEVTRLWEGAARPGHFDGVATIVAKLFNIVRPRTAFFGWKDLQQCLVVKRMVEDLDIPVELRFLETVREDDGLAMSSRNAYLSKEERAVAPALHATLLRIAIALRTGKADASAALEDARLALTGEGFQVEYLELVSMRDLEPTHATGDSAIIVAARLGQTRLIDNLRL